MNSYQGSNLPIRGDIKLIYASSFIIAILMAIVSIIGLKFQELVYPTEEFVRAFIPNDIINLCIGLPILLGSIWLAWRHKLVGLLCWAGALFFVLYNYLAYVFALPLSWAFPLHLALVMLSTYTLIGLVTSIDGKIVHQRLIGKIPEKICGGVLVGVGLLFFFRVLGVLFNSLTTGALIHETELAVNISDFIIAPTFVMVGILLWQSKEFGYVAGLGLLFLASMLFIALMVFLLVQPFLTNAPFAATDVIVIFTMGLICFIPFALFLRGVMR